MASLSAKVKNLQIAPPMAVAYFLVSLGIIAGICLLLDKWIIPRYEDAGKLVSYSWRNENLKIAKYLWARNLANYDWPVWRSEGIKVLARPVKTRRILVMGDSYVWGDGATNINTVWWRQLQRELARRGYEDVEVMAAGLCGASTREELNWAKKLVPYYAPDAVVWGYVTNDPEEVSRKTGKDFVTQIHLPEDKFSKSMNETLAIPFPDLLCQLLDIRDKHRSKRLNGTQVGYEYGQWELELLKGENFAQYKKTVSELSDFMRASKIPMFVITLPASQDRQGFLKRYEPVEKLFAQNGVLFVNILDDFLAGAKAEAARSKSSSPLWLGINPANGHPGPFASHFYASKAADVLVSRFPQCLGARNTKTTKPEGPGFNDWVPPSLRVHAMAGNSFELSYPASERDDLFMPIRKPYVELNLETPVPVTELELAGTCLKDAEVYVTSEDPSRGFDNGSLYSLGNRKGRDLAWALPDQSWASHVNTIRVSARLDGTDRKLVLRIR